MRATFFSSTLLGLGVSGTLANIVCNPSQNNELTNPTTSFLNVNTLAADIALCSERICALGKGTDDCGSVVLTITPPPGQATINVRDCIREFHNIVEQCNESGIVLGGASQLDDFSYEISVVDAQESGSSKDELVANKEHHIQRRAGKGSKNKKPNDSNVTPNNPANNDSKKKPENNPPSSPANNDPNKRPQDNSPNNPANNDPKKSPKSSTPTATLKTSVRSSPTAQPTDCQRPEDKKGQKQKGTSGTGKKTTRDFVGNGFLQAVSKALFRRADTPRPGSPSSPRPGSSSSSNSPSNPNSPTEAGASCPLADDGVKIEHLLPKKVTLWTIVRNDGIPEKLPPQSKARAVLKHMKDRSTLHVIELKNSDLSIIGNPSDGSNPPDFAKKAGNYLLTNGGFFDRDDPHKFFSVGETSSTDKHIPFPELYAEYYEELRGDDNSFLSSGPSLEKPIVYASDTKWKYHNAKKRPLPQAKLAGSLAHASQANERLAISTFANKNKYVFVYTTSNRKVGGVTTNELREVIDGFYEAYGGTMASSIRKAKQTLNMDGGGSIYVSWNEGGREKVIARGDLGKELRVVTNLVKISA